LYHWVHKNPEGEDAIFAKKKKKRQNSKCISDPAILVSNTFLARAKLVQRHVFSPTHSMGATGV
jgi:hypothetical protein